MEKGGPLLFLMEMSGRSSGKEPFPVFLSVLMAILLSVVAILLLVVATPNSLRTISRPWDSRRLMVPGGQRWRAAISTMLKPSR